MTTQFDELGLSNEILKAVEDLGFEEPSPIQVLTIPHILAGRDVIGQAQTGTGKTAAFGLPILETVDPQNRSTQALVLCPTRELAIQVAEEMSKFGARQRKINILAIYGGQPIERQFRALERGVHIVVGTPGRVMDHMERGTLKLDDLAITVLDEADEMLDMGFRDDIEHILDDCPQGQRILFSATMARAIMDLAHHYLDEPEIVKIAPKVMTVPSIEQVYYEVRPHQKMEALCRLLDSQGFNKVLAFCSTKRAVDEVTAHLMTRGYLADALHGNLVQAQRDRVMGRFRAGTIDVLVATDVAARGIDVEDVDAVINYDIPNDVENYVHRIGRTGRAGRTGKAFTFVTGRDFYRLRDIVRTTKAKILQKSLPTLNDVVNIKTTRLLNEVRAVMEQGALERYMQLIESFLDEQGSSSDMAAALLKLLMQHEFGLVESADGYDSLHAPEPSKRDRSPKEWRERESRDRDGGRERDSRDDRGKEKRGRDKFADRNKQPMARLFFNVGKKMNVSPRDLVGAIAGETGIAGRIIGAIEIHDRFSFVDVPVAVSEDVMAVMNGSQIRGNRVAVEIAIPKR